MRPVFSPRTCRHCRKRFFPVYANQQMHPQCVPLWRRRYQKLYQRKVRQEMQDPESVVL